MMRFIIALRDINYSHEARLADKADKQIGTYAKRSLAKAAKSWQQQIKKLNKKLFCISKCVLIRVSTTHLRERPSCVVCLCLIIF
jgi:Ran GTPase-activating protein (RanGAP) involved in mRNA processing and transport